MSYLEIDRLAGVMKESVENIQKQFDRPDDDWIPVMSLVPQDGENVMLAIDGRWLDTDESKDRLVDQVMIPAITGVGAKTVAMVFSVWVSTVPEGHTPEEAPRPSKDPNRTEAVMLNVMDSFKIKTWIVPIVRHDDAPPELGQWEEMGRSSLSGRFVDEVQEALRDSSGQTDPKFMEYLSKNGIELGD